jgi:lipoprotein-anchoring transpeptidase ErfK/SrfK
VNKRNIIIIIAIAAVVAGALWALGRGKKDVTMVDEVVAANQPNVDIKLLQQQAAVLKSEGELIKAKEIYRSIVTDYPFIEDIQSVQQQLESVNLEILFSNLQTEDTLVHEVVSGDSLDKLAKKYTTTIDLIKRSNNLKSDVIRVGQKLRVWTGKFNIHVDKSQNVLLLKEGDEVIKVYRVSTGSDNSTPIGTYKITSKLPDPVWFNKGIVLPPESPENVLGTRWLGFDLPGYGIHGTIEPETIGQQVTAGCVRMRNEEVEELYSIVPLGTEVTIVN